MTLTVDCDFPGGNIIVEGIDGDVVTLRQDPRDTEGWWFYWYFRVRNLDRCINADRCLTFCFTDGDVVGTRGPAFSTDGGQTWRWLGRDCVNTVSGGVQFTFSPSPSLMLSPSSEIRFAFAMPYLQSHLDAFLAQHTGNPYLRQETLCHTRKGRRVEVLHLGCLDREPAHRVLLTSRHHACESVATYGLEGIMAAILAENATGAWLREHVAFFIVPFMDKDGVEDGDQGKNRRPHDHNRDYGVPGSAASTSLYATTRALRERIPTWSAGKLRVALDMHCPWIRGEHNEVVYFVGSPDQANWARVGDLSHMLEAVQRGPLVYRVADNLPFGVAWNTAQNTAQGRSFGRWAAALPGIQIGTSIEIPYANVRETTVTAAAARAFGRDLARALKIYLQKK